MVPWLQLLVPLTSASADDSMLEVLLKLPKRLSEDHAVSAEVRDALRDQRPDVACRDRSLGVQQQPGEMETCLNRIKWTADNVFGDKAGCMATPTAIGRMCCSTG